ncbi:MAG: OmpA family protein [Bacteroidota bacterium]
MKSTCLILLCTSIFSFLSAQNLIHNGSFEDHRDLDCMNCHLSSRPLSYLLPNWDRLNSHPFICDCDYQKNRSEKRENICQYQENLKAFDGCTMAEMAYMPNCLDYKHETRGCAAYLGTELLQPLERGKKYRVSFWLYIKTPDDLDYAQHIGFMPFQEKIRNQNGAMLKQNIFQIDTVIYEKWYQVSWEIQSTCEQKFIVFGVFKGDNSPQVHSLAHRNLYYIDLVEVIEIEQAKQEEIILFCKPKVNSQAPIVESVEGFNCYFESGKANLSPDCKSVIASFATRAKEKPKTTFLITGHTDNLGKNHTILSQERIDSVSYYLHQIHQLPPVRFINIPMGNSYADQSAISEKDRRVEIVQTDYELPMVVYRNLIDYIQAEQYIQAFKALRIWLNLSNIEDQILLFYDPRLEKLRSLSQWEGVVTKVHKTYQKEYKANAKLTFQLDSLWAEDQKYRTLSYYIENLRVYLPEIDTIEALWKVSFEADSTTFVMQDQNNLSALQFLIGEEKWIKQSTTSERAALANFYIIQHSSDTDLMEHSLPILKERCEQGEANWLHYAMLYDRRKILLNLPQRFGTQYRILKDDTKELFPLENEEMINIWRDKIGLPPIER